jgi:hypothetical protein
MKLFFSRALVAGKLDPRTPPARPLIFKAREVPEKPQLTGDGATEVHRTRSGKPIFAGGHDVGKYDDDDHVDAGTAHHRLAEHHDEQQGHHREIAGKDEDWKRAELHDQEADRHGKLSEHHAGLARQHLTAAGRGAGAELETGEDGAPRIGASAPLTDKERQEAREGLGRRTHHQHPGGLQDADRAAYRKHAGQKEEAA